MPPTCKPPLPVYLHSHLVHRNFQYLDILSSSLYLLYHVPGVKTHQQTWVINLDLIQLIAMPCKKRQKVNALQVYNLTHERNSSITHNISTISNTTRTTREVVSSVPVESESRIDTAVDMTIPMTSDETSDIGCVQIKGKAKWYENLVSYWPFLNLVLDTSEIQLGRTIGHMETIPSGISQCMPGSWGARPRSLPQVYSLLITRSIVPMSWLFWRSFTLCHVSACQTPQPSTTSHWGEPTLLIIRPFSF